MKRARQTTAQTLPVSCLSIAFAYLDPKQLLTSSRLVCSAWRHVPAAWTSLDLTCVVALERTLGACCCLSLVHTVRLTNAVASWLVTSPKRGPATLPGVTRIGLEVKTRVWTKNLWARFPALRVLDVVGQSKKAMFKAIFPPSHGIESVNISGAGLWSCENLFTGARLRSVALSSVFLFPREHFAEVCRNLQTTEFSLDRLLDFHDIEHFVRASEESGKRWRRLHIGSRDIWNLAFRPSPAFFEDITDLTCYSITTDMTSTNLRTLSLGFLPPWFAIWEQLGLAPSLETLSLDFDFPPSAAYRFQRMGQSWHMLTALAPSQSLKTLVLGSVPALTAADACIAAVALANLETLTVRSVVPSERQRKKLAEMKPNLVINFA